MQIHNTENLKQIFPEKELRGLSLNFHIHESVSDLYIPAISLPILLQENRWTAPWNIYVNISQIHKGGKWDVGCAIPFLGIHKWDFLCSVRHSFVLFIPLTSISSSVTDSPMKRIIMANSRRSMNPFPS
jgi:hypothetical protein